MKKSNIIFLRRVVESNFKRLQFPFKLSFAVTYRCNLRCSMCNIWKKNYSANELNVDEINQFFSKANNFSWVGITGGEPFLRNDLCGITDIVIKYCRYLNVIHFATNAQLKDQITSVIDNIRAKNRKIKIAFTISIDGPPDLHDKIRGKEGIWKNAIDMFICLKKIKLVDARIGFTMSSYNVGKFGATFVSLKDAYPHFRFDDISIYIFQKSEFYYENQEMKDLDPVAIKNEIAKIEKMDNDKSSINNFLRRRYLKLYRKYLDTKKCPLKCQALSSACFLDPYGNIFPCGVYNKKLINIRNMNSSLEAVWNSDYAESLSYECSHSICPGCWSPCDAYSAIGGSLLRTAKS